MKKILIVVDMQNDFVSGSLGSEAAKEVVGNVVNKIKTYKTENVYATRDTHFSNYLETQEGEKLPVPHCIYETEGWQLEPSIKPLIKEENIFNKPTFGCVGMINKIEQLRLEEDIEIELIGVCTDICVVSNALLLKAYFPETKISVDSSCCAGSSIEAHESALTVLRSCLVDVK